MIEVTKYLDNSTENRRKKTPQKYVKDKVIETYLFSMLPLDSC